MRDASRKKTGSSQNNHYGGRLCAYGKTFKFVELSNINNYLVAVLQLFVESAILKGGSKAIRFY